MTWGWCICSIVRNNGNVHLQISAMMSQCGRLKYNQRTQTLRKEGYQTRAEAKRDKSKKNKLDAKWCCSATKITA